ncbi:hypothetical protein PSPO01_10793 [Paraphaeosphaeria sporulosa]
MVCGPSQHHTDESAVPAYIRVPGDVSPSRIRVIPKLGKRSALLECGETEVTLGSEHGMPEPTRSKFRQCNSAVSASMALSNIVPKMLSKFSPALASLGCHRFCTTTMGGW